MKATTWHPTTLRLLLRFKAKSRLYWRASRSPVKQAYAESKARKVIPDTPIGALAPRPVQTAVRLDFENLWVIAAPVGLTKKLQH